LKFSRSAKIRPQRRSALRCMKPSLCSTRPPTQLTIKPSNEASISPSLRSGETIGRTLSASPPNNELGQGRSRAADVTVTQVRRLLCGKLILVLQAGQPILGIGRYPRLVGRLEIDPV